MSITTAADLLSIMSVLNNEIDVTLGGADEAKAVLALSIAQRHCFKVAAGIRGCLSTAKPVGETLDQARIVTVANQEWTAKPAGLLRLDALWALSTDGSNLPIYPLRDINETGGHMPTLPWPLSWTVSVTGGQPFAYYEDNDSWYWQPRPSAVYYMRAYGLWLPSDFADRTTAIAIPGNGITTLADALCAFALKYLTGAINDPIDTLNALAAEMFAPALKMLVQRDRSKGKSKTYGSIHST